MIEPPDQKDKVDPDGVDADVNAGADANDPELDVPKVTGTRSAASGR